MIRMDKISSSEIRAKFHDSCFNFMASGQGNSYLEALSASPNPKDNFSFPNDDEVFLVSLPPNYPKLRGTPTSFIHRC
jgi:hypothetical protein